MYPVTMNDTEYSTRFCIHPHHIVSPDGRIPRKISRAWKTEIPGTLRAIRGLIGVNELQPI